MLGTRLGAPADWLPATELIRPGPRARRPARQGDGEGATPTGPTSAPRCWPRATRSRCRCARSARCCSARGFPRWRPTRCACEFAAGDATITGVAYAGGAYGIAGDACAGDPSLALLPDEDALLAQLHAELHDHLEPLLVAIAAASGRPLRALWRSAGDRLGGAFLWLGEVVGMRERAWDLGTRAMRAGGPLAVGADFRVLEHAGIAEPTRNRRSCCLIYRVAGNDTCFTCPLTSEAARRERLAARAAQPA